MVNPMISVLEKGCKAGTGKAPVLRAPAQPHPALAVPSSPSPDSPVIITADNHLSLCHRKIHSAICYNRNWVYLHCLERSFSIASAKLFCKPPFTFSQLSYLDALSCLFDFQ